MGAMVSKAIGARQRDHARIISTSIMLTAFLISCTVAAVMFFNIPLLLDAIGAEGLAAERAEAYLKIILPSGPVIAIAMAAGAGLRAAGDAKRSMWATLSGGIVNAVLDPLFIFGFGWNVEGAAIASVFARFTVLFFSLYPLIKSHDLVASISIPAWLTNLKPILAIAIPAIITNIATPIGNAIVTTTLAQFGENFVAGFAVIGRLTPVCFAVIFALSGAVGPIIGQNFGAERMDRVKETLNNSLIVTTAYTIFVCIVLYLVQGLIVEAFSLQGDAAIIVVAFCSYVAFSFIFNGAQFVANTSFNNLGKPLYSTALNLGKATLGTLPFVHFGAQWFGALGVLYGQALGSVVFGLLAIVVLRKHISDLMRGACQKQLEEDPSITSVNSQPFCSHDAVLIDDVPVAGDISPRLKENV
jgi:putative MATE family efflux protein